MRDIIHKTKDPLAYHHSKHHTLAYIVPLFIIIAGFGIWLYCHNHQKAAPAPIDQLGRLDAVSVPVTATPEEQAAAMDALSKEKTGRVSTPEERKALLNSSTK